ncbi:MULTISPECIES: DUF2510 domain-containing protein [unclassified Microbacterium]|uniref:DUF2510 domain-containing protein n=1 Tax=unclassified Microbacterium TaxID=2609290 RepID=UPI001604D631|nr:MULTISPECIES: DUF2510 domain-containing protein [unclassified Microbacterium]QNA92073.1 DUF2510 domain-containing protein [Microbacterium sp. Se63.02b]QYM65313.1 DUF2510 domain-containing protein [Microbacterium sp. Se5.02b]
MSERGIPAGWYETRRRGTRRWWDGARWTEHIAVHGRETTLAADTAAVRRQLLVSEAVLGVVLVGSILIALWGGLPVVVVRPVIVAVGAALVITPLLITRQLRLAALPSRRYGVPPLR